MVPLQGVCGGSTKPLAGEGVVNHHHKPGSAWPKEAATSPGNPMANFAEGGRLIDALGVRQAPTLPEKAGLGIVTVRELGITPSNFFIGPKTHAILEYVPQVMDGDLSFCSFTSEF